MVLEMPRVDAPEDLSSAWQQLRLVRQKLLDPSPDALNDCIPLLEKAARALRTIETAPGASSEHNLTLRSDLARFRSELSVVNALLQHAANFYLGWAQLLAGAVADGNTGGYTSSGDAVLAIVSGPRIKVRG